MAATKSGAVWLAAMTCAVGTPQTTSVLNMSTAYAGLITAQILNGSTAPTVACTVTVNISYDGTDTWEFYASGTAGLVASTSYPFSFEIPPAAMYVELVFSGNTGQSVTVSAQNMLLTGL